MSKLFKLLRLKIHTLLYSNKVLNDVSKPYFEDTLLDSSYYREMADYYGVKSTNDIPHGVRCHYWNKKIKEILSDPPPMETLDNDIEVTSPRNIGVIIDWGEHISEPGISPDILRRGRGVDGVVDVVDISPLIPTHISQEDKSTRPLTGDQWLKDCLKENHQIDEFIDSIDQVKVVEKINNLSDEEYQKIENIRLQKGI